MDSGRGVEGKTGSNEVVVSISGTEGTSRKEKHGRDSNNTQIENTFPNAGLTESESLKARVQNSSRASSGPRISKASTVRDKPSDGTFTHRRSLARSAYSKPKSRLVEPPHPYDSSHLFEDNSQALHSTPSHIGSLHIAPSSNTADASTPRERIRAAAVTPKKPLMAASEGEDVDDNDVYKIAKIKVCKQSAWEVLINRGLKRSRKTSRILKYITKALASCLTGAAMWMVKTFLVKLLASSFHVSRFFDRIQDSIFHQYVLQRLSGPSLMNYDGNTSSGRMSFKSLKEGKQLNKEVINVDKLHKIKQEKVSAWTMGGLIKVIQGSHLSTLTGALSESSDDEGNETKDKEITCEWEAKAAADRIFEKIARPHFEYIEKEDLFAFMKKEEVEHAFSTFEGAAEMGIINKSSFRKWVVHAYKERKMLAHCLNDSKTAIEELNRIASGIVLVLIFIVWLLLMGFATTQVLLFISSQLLLAVFMFGNSCRTLFEAIIFVFVMHPFDVGDRCVIDGVQMVVEEMNILTTIFLRYDNEKIFYPNSVLASKPISNFNRSPEMGDAVDFAIDVSTSAQSIVALKDKIKEYIARNPNYWRPCHTMIVKDIENVNKMNMALYVNHTINFQNYVEKINRRSELVLELKEIFKELGIKYQLLPQEVHLVHSGPSSQTSSGAAW
ncbi:hypothetical protein NMG60_11022034 [Bertholletia excelsa]